MTTSPRLAALAASVLLATGGGAAPENARSTCPDGACPAELTGQVEVTVNGAVRTATLRGHCVLTLGEDG
ncbi:hypothetical protein [Allokutzneria albata]|uniref:Uncharacterized protein n=1 Tax=Allokutzneria albata TaxID=211114 RepID=A0A1G9RXW9_ALLAB|nr:hypothetical protein [Allokutzneria albata]SDM28012.1 hypothetical protein SAMN04489726_0761 [Allokutzneria albata]